MIVKEPGRYYLSVTKAEYNYPTKYLRGETQDLKYLDLYHGEEIEVKARRLPAIYVVFDILEKDAKTLVGMPLFRELSCE
jgi:hypothetical protein